MSPDCWRKIAGEPLVNTGGQSSAGGADSWSGVTIVRNRTFGAGARRIVSAMSTVVSGPRVKVGVSHGDVRVAKGGKLVLVGYVKGTLTVAPGGYAFLIGMMEGLTVESGGKATMRGWCKGDAVNEGGDLAVMRGAVIEGTLFGREFTRVDPEARIGGL